MQLGLSVALVLLSALAPDTEIAADNAAECSQIQIQTGNCPPRPDNTGNEIVVGGTGNEDGRDGSDGRDGDDGVAGPAQPDPPSEFEQCMDDWNRYIHCFERPGPEDPADPGTPAIPAVTITDVARFAPGGAIVAAEPDNVGVAGLPANFVATASAQTVDGELFGYPISVRFTPVGFDFDYGDGSTATTPDGGRSWATLGQAQFTPTATSHVYAQRGEYTATVDVRYTAEIDLGIGWFPIDGEVTSEGAGQQVRIFEAHTALVAYTCEQAPSSPGC